MILILNVDSRGGDSGCGWCQFLSINAKNATCNLFHETLPLWRESGDRILVGRCGKCLDQEALSVARDQLEGRDLLRIEIKKQAVTECRNY